MVTNLVFKRTVTTEGSSRTEMKIIEVDIPELRSSEGWTLVSSADKVSTVNLPRTCGESEKKIDTTNRDADADKAAEFLTNLIKSTSENIGCQSCNCAQSDIATLHAYKQTLDAQSVNVAYKPSEIKDAEEAANIKEYPSPVDGTACLVRRGNIIRIAFRRGKNANINTPNRVCISDKDKQSFFNAVRAENNGKEPTKWQLEGKSGITLKFNWWNNFIDNEYKEQKMLYIRKKNKGY